MHNKDLVDKLLKASELIHKSTIKGSADYLITSPNVSQMIQDVYIEQRSNYRKEKIRKIFND